MRVKGAEVSLTAWDHWISAGAASVVHPEERGPAAKRGPRFAAARQTAPMASASSPSTHAASAGGLRCARTPPGCGTRSASEMQRRFGPLCINCQVNAQQNLRDQKAQAPLILFRQFAPRLEDRKQVRFKSCQQSSFSATQAAATSQLGSPAIERSQYTQK